MVSIDIGDTQASMMTITENGYGKHASFDEYRTPSRGERIISIQTSERNGIGECTCGNR